MADNGFNNIVSTMMKGMEGFLSAKTVVGEPTIIGDTTIVPLVDVSFGVGAGASSETKGGGGLTGKMSPSAVLVIKNDTVRLVNVKNQDSLTKILDMVPDLIDKFTGPKEKLPSDSEVKEAAFPESNE